MAKTIKLMGIIFFLAALLGSCSKDDDEPQDDFTGTTGSFVDERDGHNYKWVKIGDQTWMAENLTYDTGDGCWVYEYNNEYEKKYGRLYSWDAAMAASPNGWHLPSDAEWKQLAEYISTQHGGITKQDNQWPFIGTMLKASSGWSNDGNGTDDYGFNALPAGTYDSYPDEFWGIGDRCYWWTATPSEHITNGAYLRGVIYRKNLLFRDEEGKSYGVSMRCVKD